MDKLWERARERLRGELEPNRFEAWIEQLAFGGMQGKTFIITGPSRFVCEHVKEQFGGSIQRAVAAEAGDDIVVKLTFNGGAKTSEKHANGNGRAATPGNSGHAGARQTNGNGANGVMLRVPRIGQLDPRYTFDEFVVGPNNQFAHAAAVAVAHHPGVKYNPLFIYGGVGLGKTHLATAIGHYLSAQGRRVILMNAEAFMNELIASLRRDQMGDFKERFRKVDAFILDDIHFLAGRERSQEEFFHTFNAIQAERHQIVLTSDRVPRDIPELEERLRNRFESGLIVDVAPPDLETRIAIVQKKAGNERLNVPQDVAVYIAQNVSSNVRELEGCLTRLSAVASFSSSPITLEFAQSALRDLICDRPFKPDMERIIQTVAEAYHVRVADLKSKKRTQHIAFCRQVAMFLCRKMTGNSFPAIGNTFARDHSTVIHAYTVIARRVGNEPPFRLELEKIERQIKEGRK